MHVPQAAYKIGSEQTILSHWQQGKLKDETGSFFPSVEERKRQANAARTLSDVFENSIGVALRSQIHEQLGPLAAISALAGGHHSIGASTTALNVVSNSSSASLQPSNVARPLGVAGLPRSAGMQLDSIHLQEELYMHAARSFVGSMKPDVSTHDSTMQGLGALLGNSTAINTTVGELDTRALPPSRRNHRATNNIEPQTIGFSLGPLILRKPLQTRRQAKRRQGRSISTLELLLMIHPEMLLKMLLTHEPPLLLSIFPRLFRPVIFHSHPAMAAILISFLLILATKITFFREVCFPRVEPLQILCRVQSAAHLNLWQP
jgi:hypothetical protein